MGKQLFTVLILACVAVSLSVAVVVTYRDVLREEWNEFKARYNKTYVDQTEDNYRFKIFLETKHKIAKHNQRHANGLHSYTLGINKYADMSHKEFVRTMNGYRPHLKRSQLGGSLDNVKPSYFEEQQAWFRNEKDGDIELPRSMDWRRLGYVTPVKDQGHCGSCWAFSSTGALEGQHYHKTGNLISLSEQNLVDCSKKYGNMGCDGGLMANAFRYIHDNHGVDTENSYPYEAHEDKCRFRNKTVGADDKGFIELPSGDEKKLVKAIATKGPISIAIDASQESFRLYESGVYDEPACGNEEENLDHGVLVVGYGTDAIHGDYYIVKNSWSETWGEAGYIKMSRNKENQCGIATSAVYPVV